MSGIQGKRWVFFVWDIANIEHLAIHGVHPDVIAPNKKKHGPKRFRIDGVTDAGRCLRLIFEDKGKNVARIFTGWDL